MNEDKDNLLVLRVETEKPQKVEVKRVQLKQSFSAAQYAQAMQGQQAAAYAAQQQIPPLTGIGSLAYHFATAERAAGIGRTIFGGIL